MASIGDDTKTHGQGFRFSSDLRDDIWHADAETGAYEWWYFDAVSDEGREALVVIFLADFVFSPRYNKAVAERLRSGAGATRPAQFPAVAFCLYRDGRPVWRAINEYTADDFAASRTRPECRIGQSRFQLETSGGNRSFQLAIDEPLRGGRRLKGAFTWEVVEGDYASASGPQQAPSSAGSHDWNLVAPHCRVAGDYSISGGDTGAGAGGQFRGVGYHDHNRDRRWLPATVDSWQWGRAHFADATAVFYRYRETPERSFNTRVFLTRQNTLRQLPATFTARRTRQHHFGLRYPFAFDLNFEYDGRPALLSVRQPRIIDGSYFYLRFLGDATLDLGDGRPRRAPAITEHLAPRALRWRWLDWLTSMRIGMHGRGSFLP